MGPSNIRRIIRLFRNIFKKSPNYLILFVTSRCNSKCKICCNWGNLQSLDNRNKKGKDLTLSEIFKIAKNFKNIEYLTISGGEPFLRKDLPLIIKIFRQVSNVQIVNISTNGSLPKISHKMIKKILTENTELLLNIDISIDAIGKDHDEIRGFPGNYDLLKKTYLLLNNLSKKNSNLTLRSSTVLSKFNQTKIKELYSHIKSQFEFDMPTISLVRGNPRDKQSLKVEKINYLHLINYIKKDIKKNPPKSLINKILMSLKTLGWDIIANVLVRENFCIPCKSGKKMFVIDHKGVLFPCEILHRSFGSFRAYNYDLDKLLQTEKARKIKNFIESRKCKCTFECAIQNSIVDYSPYYYIILKKLLLRNY